MSGQILLQKLIKQYKLGYFQFNQLEVSDKQIMNFHDSKMYICNQIKTTVSDYSLHTNQIAKKAAVSFSCRVVKGC